MRENLQRLYTSTSTAHAGLLMQRGLREWQTGEKTIKAELVDKIAHIKPNELYLLAFNRWLKSTYKKDTYATVAAHINGRLFTGLPLGGTLETGVMTHHSYGMPMLAGSSVKGAVRSYTEQLFCKRLDTGDIDYLTVKKDGKSVKKMQFSTEKQAILDVLFGATDTEDTENTDSNANNAGYLIWHDAWWLPPISTNFTLSLGENSKPYIGEIVTVHHQKYYNGELEEALDIESPVPNQQLAIQGDFYFVIEGVHAWVEYAKKLLEATLQDMGLGSKTAAGYGYFTLDEHLQANLTKRFKVLDIEVDPNDDPIEAKIKLAVVKYDEEQLIDSLSKGINKFFTKLELDKSNPADCEKVAKVIYALKPDTINNWENSQGNAEKAYKFIKKNS